MNCRWYWNKIGGGWSCGECPKCYDMDRLYDHNGDRVEEEE